MDKKIEDLLWTVAKDIPKMSEKGIFDTLVQIHTIGFDAGGFHALQEFFNQEKRINQIVKELENANQP